MTQTAGFKAETEADVFNPFALVRMDLPSGTVRFFSGVGELSWNSQTWTGAGELGFVGKIDSGTQLRAGFVEIGLSGLESSLKADVLNYVARGAETFVYMGFYDSSGAIVADPWLAYYGRLDTTDVEDGAGGLTIKCRIIDGVGARLRQTKRRRTDADQQEIYSGDKVFEFVADMRHPEPWGATPSQQTGGGSSGNGNRNLVRVPGNALNDGLNAVQL